MAPVQRGDVVKVTYSVKSKSGEVLQAPDEVGPLLFTVGEEEVLPEFEQAVIGMNPGDTKTFVIPAAEAYGPYRDDLVFVIDPKVWPSDIPLQIGQEIELQPQDVPESEDENTFLARVTEINADSIVLDANHPLAKEDLVFTIESVEVQPKRQVA